MTPSPSGPNTKRTRRQTISDSLLDRSLGRFGGWQMSLAPGQSAKRQLEIRSGEGAIIHRVEGAPLGAIEHDVLTWACARWVRSGAGEDGTVRTTLYEIAKALYGDREIGGLEKRRIAEAIDNLFWASVTLTDWEALAKQQAEGSEELPTLFSDRRLVVQIDYGEELKRLRDGGSVASELIGGLRDETLVLHISPWLTKRLDEEALRAWLDFPVQRRLGTGMGKRLWIWIETCPDYVPLPSDETKEMVTVDLTEEVYAELGAKCQERWDNRKAIRRGLEKLLEIDERYVRHVDEVTPGCEVVVGRGKRPDVLRVVRGRRHLEPALG